MALPRAVGFELVLACDLIVAAEHAEFFLPELSLTSCPTLRGAATAAPAALVRGHGPAFTSCRLEAQEVAWWGLVRSVVPGDRLMDEARRLGEQIASRPPAAVQATKEIARGEGLTVEEQFAAMAAGEWPGAPRRWPPATSSRAPGRSPRARTPDGHEPGWRSRWRRTSCGRRRAVTMAPGSALRATALEPPAPAPP